MKNLAKEDSGWAIGLGSIANAGVNLINGYLTREQNEKLKKIELEFQEAQRKEDRELQAKVHRERIALEREISAENNRLLREEGNNNRQARLTEIKMNLKYNQQQY